MKSTLSQIEKSLNNTFEVGTDGSRDLYNAIRLHRDNAVINVGTKVKKTEHYFTASDWRKVYNEIKSQLAKHE